MTPVTPEPRPGTNLVVFAKHQPQYHPLPANCGPEGLIETKWQLSWRERLHALLHGSLYLRVQTFNQDLQPIRMSVTRE